VPVKRSAAGFNPMLIHSFAGQAFAGVIYLR
jgi:hypothetical protein